TLFPYTTLFRSADVGELDRVADEVADHTNDFGRIDVDRRQRVRQHGAQPDLPCGGDRLERVAGVTDHRDHARRVLLDRDLIGLHTGDVEQARSGAGSATSRDR